MKSSDPGLIRLIAFFNLLKAVLLIFVGVGALKLVHTDISAALGDWIARLGLDLGGRHLGRIILHAATLTPTKIKDLAVGSFIYAGLFLTEAIQLSLLKRWPHWLTVLITPSLVPLK